MTGPTTDPRGALCARCAPGHSRTKASPPRDVRYRPRADRQVYGPLWATVAVCLLAAVASAATYYVSPSGSANNPGTRSEPWSMAKANSTLTAGDTAVLLDGTYSTAIEPSNDGSSGSPITYQADTKHGADIPTIDYPIELDYCSYIIVDGVECTNNKRWVRGSGADHITIKNCYFEDADGWETMRFQDSGGYIVVKDCHIENGTDSLHIREGSHHHIVGNTFDTATHTCLVIMAVENTVVEDNTFTNMGEKCMEVFSLRGETENPVKCKYNLIQNNYFGPTDYSGIQYAGNYSILRYNTFHECDVGMNWANYGGSDPTDDPEAWWDEHNRFYHNTLYHCEQAINCSGLSSLFDGDGALGDNIHRNNIVHYSSSAKLVCIDWDASPDQLAFYYNDVIRSSAGQDIFYWADKPGPDNYYTLSEIETDQGTWYADNIESDPAFVDAGGDDFELQGTSPCVDAGAALTRTNGSGTGRVVTVDDALYFTDGYGIIDGDAIRIGDDSCTVVDVDYDNDQITIEDTIAWSDEDSVSMDYQGNAPDIGRYEYDSGTVANAAPTVSAGSDDTITLPNYATLDGTVSDDGLPDPPGSLTTTWSKDSGPGTVTFGDASAVDTTAGFSEAGTYVLKLEADDGTATDSDTGELRQQRHQLQ